MAQKPVNNSRGATYLTASWSDLFLGALYAAVIQVVGADIPASVLQQRPAKTISAGQGMTPLLSMRFRSDTVPETSRYARTLKSQEGRRENQIPRLIAT